MTATTHETSVISCWVDGKSKLLATPFFFPFKLFQPGVLCLMVLCTCIPLYPNRTLHPTTSLFRFPERKASSPHTAPPLRMHSDLHLLVSWNIGCTVPPSSLMECSASRGLFRHAGCEEVLCSQESHSSSLFCLPLLITRSRDGTLATATATHESFLIFSLSQDYLNYQTEHSTVR